MEPREVRTIEDAIAIVEELQLTHVKVGVFDIDGIMRGKYMSREKFISSLKKGFGFCDVVLGWDSDDQLYDNVKFTGWHTGYPDAPARIIPESCRELPFEDTLLFIAEFAPPADTVGPRAALRRVVNKAESLGFKAFASVELEFFVFTETPDTVREKGYRNLQPVAPGNFGYSVLRNSTYSDLYEMVLRTAEIMDMPIEGLHEETGPGVLEAALAVDEIMSAGDKAALFKTFTKVACQKAGYMAAFMAKWSEKYPGQSGHIHMSLQNLDGTSAFYQEDGRYTMTETMEQFVAGCQVLMPEMLVMLAPTVNSFTRMVPGAWAPTSATWGLENRTTALRVIQGGPSSQRMEHRVGAADINPYLGLAAVLACGLYGIENKLKLGEPIHGNAYEAQIPDELSLPATLTEAADRFEASSAARDAFGDAFVEHFAASRRWEEREFRKAVTDWELQRYFEII